MDTKAVIVVDIRDNACYQCAGRKIAAFQVPNGKPNWGNGTTKNIWIAKLKRRCNPNLPPFVACKFYQSCFSLPFYCVRLFLV